MNDPTKKSLLPAVAWRAWRTVVALCTLVPLLGACAKTVEWKEEVALNTGDTIWVTRSVEYSLQGGAGNPLDMRYRPERNEAIEFEWKGKKYAYRGDAVLMLLAIAPDGRPNLVARAEDNSWNFVHHYACVLPFYVQLTPQADGRNWSWPTQIEPWLYGLRSNLLLNRDPPERMLRQYTSAQRESRDAVALRQTPSFRSVLPDFAGDLCRKPRRK